MGDWREKIEEHWRKHQEESARLAEEEKARKQGEVEEFFEERKKDMERVTIEFGKKYFCKLCGKPSTGPLTRAWTTENDGVGADYEHEETHWDTPRDLVNCAICGEWVCHDCTHLKICKKCAENL